MKPRNLLRAAAIAGAAVAVGAWTSAGRGRELDDRAFVRWNAEGGRTADAAFGSITELGSIWAAVGAGTALAILGRRRAAVRGLAAAGTAWLAGQGLKKVFLRPRPYVADVVGTRLRIGAPRATSWPSSHPAVLLAFTTAAASELAPSPLARLGFDGLALAVGASRTYLGVHYPSDVVGGLLLGRAVAVALES